MRADKKSFTMWMSETEKQFVEEMAWRKKMKIAQYIRMMIRKEMSKNEDVVNLIKQRS